MLSALLTLRLTNISSNMAWQRALSMLYKQVLKLRLLDLTGTPSLQRSLLVKVEELLTVLGAVGQAELYICLMT
jgi:hypothetical protein